MKLAVDILAFEDEISGHYQAKFFICTFKETKKF